MISHMTTRAQAIPDIVLTAWTEGVKAPEHRSGARRASAWVVEAPRSPAMWYRVVLSNLHCGGAGPEPATMDAVRSVLSAGLSRTAFERLKLILNVSSEELGKTVRISPRTLTRRAKFKPDESERILRVASAFQRTLDVFGSLDKARRWFAAPKRALGDKTPLEFCDTEPGAQEVEHLLGRIEHGVFT
jgi:putative toxin-antitoxin system antitoxin component (TIGR02293 family)